MYSEGSPGMPANNETAYNYFRKSADKVCYTLLHFMYISYAFFCVFFLIRNWSFNSDIWNYFE